MAFCIYCGAKLEDDHRFCGSCGARVTADIPPAAPAPEVPAYTATVVEKPAQAAPAAETPAYAAPVVETPAYTAPVAELVAEKPIHTEVKAEAPAEPTVISIPQVEKTSEAAPQEKPVPAAPLAAAPITREHVRNAATPSGAQPMPFGNKSARGSSASYSYATQERVSNPVKNKAVRSPRKFLSVFCSVLICVLILVMMLPTFTLITASNTLKQETFLAVMRRIDLDKIPASILDEYDEDLEGMSFAEALCKAINEEVDYYTGDYYLDGQVVTFEWEELTPESLDRFLEETTFLPFIAEQAEGFIHAYLSGKATYTIPAKALEQLLTENVPYIVEELGVPVENENYQLFVEELMESMDVGEIEMPYWTSSEREALNAVHVALSVTGIGACCLVLLLLVLLLFVANHRDPMYAVRDTGIVCVLGTVLPLLAMLGARISVSTFAGKDAVMYIVTTILSCIAESSLIVIGGIFVLGIVLLILNGIVRKVQSKRYA